ncbi:MAG: tryptophan synthase subunit alpha [Rhodobacteraceae bacterium]|jgi:tryptophan synthase alpha chain|nr:tryptophan synthase subunit alpha [Paracoccaceae bacterium]
MTALARAFAGDASPAAAFPAAGRQRSLCPLIMVGDPDLATTRALLRACVDLGVGMVELCLPFANAFTDGDTLRRAHARALADDPGLDGALALIREFSDRIAIVLLADCSHTLRPHGFAEVCRAARDAGAAAILPHGLPPRLADGFHRTAAGVIPVVGTMYLNSPPDVRRAVVGRTTAFLYLVSGYGRSGGGAPPDASPEIAALRGKTALPIALGFGLKTPGDVRGAFAMGCDIAIVGSAVSAALESGLGAGDPVGAASALIAALNAEVAR